MSSKVTLDMLLLIKIFFIVFLTCEGKGFITMILGLVLAED